MTTILFSQVHAYMSDCMNDEVHDTLHVERVLNYALQIADCIPDVDADVIILSALLHDVGRPEEYANSTLCHAEIGSKKALDFLLSAGLDAQTAQHVSRCIATHRYKKSHMPASLEAKILYDADKLDLTGSVGVARSILFGGQIEEPIYRMTETGLPALGLPGEADSLLKEYHGKLKNLQQVFFTLPAQQIAATQQPAMDAFFAALTQQIDQNHRQGRRLLQKYNAIL